MRYVMVSEIENEIIRVGVIGLGTHSSQSHLQHLAAAHDLCEVTAICDIDEQRIQAESEKHGLSAETFTDWKQLESAESVDAVFIMTPDRFHIAQLAGAVALRKPVFCEKPLASTEEGYEVLKSVLADAEQDGTVVADLEGRARRRISTSSGASTTPPRTLPG